MRAERTAGHHGKAVLWLGTSDAPLALITHLRSRGIAVGTRSDDHTPVARLMLVETALSPAARNASVKGRRVAVIHPDPGSADALAQALRGRGAQVVALSLNPEALERVEALDPDAVLMEVTDFYGSCWEIVRALWQHPRLKYAPVLLATPEGVASYAQGTPDVPSLCLAVQTVSATYQRVERACQHEDEFEVELAELGPARLLRALTESQRNLRLTVACPAADFEIDVSQGIIAGAQGSARGAAHDLYLGVHALALLMTQERGHARARVADRPAATNIMAPLDAALHAAREAKAAAPQDVAATREVVARMPDPGAAAQSSTAATSEPARPPPARTEEPKASATRKAPAITTTPASRELPTASTEVTAPEVTAPEVKAPEVTAPTEVTAPEVKEAPVAPAKTLLGLPPPRRTTSTGRVMAVVPRESTDASGGPLPAVQAARPSAPQPAVASAVALGRASTAAALLQSELQPALAADNVPTRECECVVDTQDEESRVMVARGQQHHEPVLAPTDGTEESPQAADFEQPRSEPRAWAFRLHRTHLGPALGALGLVALGLLASRLFASEASQGDAPTPLPAVIAAPAPPTPHTAPPQPAAAQPIPDAPRAAHQGERPEDPGDEGDDGSDSDATSSSGGLPPARKASALVSQGHNLRKHKQYTQARARYEAALTLLPNYPRALAGLAQVAIAQNKGKDALAYAQKLVQVRPGQGEYQLLLGDAYKTANMPKEAQQAWQAAVRAGNATAKTRLKPVSSAASPVPAGKSGTPVKGPSPSVR